MDNPDALFTVGMLREKINHLPNDMIIGHRIHDGSDVEIHGVEAEVQEYKAPWPHWTPRPTSPLSKYEGQKILTIG